jgi:hypothetical protein
MKIFYRLDFELLWCLLQYYSCFSPKSSIPVARRLGCLSLVSRFHCHQGTKDIILSRVLVIIDGVWIGNWIYWPLTGRNYKWPLHYCWFPHYKSLNTNIIFKHPVAFIYTSYTLKYAVFNATLSFSFLFILHFIFALQCNSFRLQFMYLYMILAWLLIILYLSILLRKLLHCNARRHTKLKQFSPFWRKVFTSTLPTHLHGVVLWYRTFTWSCNYRLKVQNMAVNNKWVLGVRIHTLTLCLGILVIQLITLIAVFHLWLIS